MQRIDIEDDATEFIEQASEKIDHEFKLKNIIEKIRDLMKKYKYGKVRDELQEIIKEDIGIEITTEIDVKTRWNSLLAMLTKFMKLKKYFIIHLAKQNRIFDFNQAEVDKIEDIILVLEPIEIAIKDLSKDKTNLISADLIMTKLLKSIPSTSFLGAEAINALDERIRTRRKRWSDYIWKLSMSGIVDNDENVFYEPVSDSEIENFYSVNYADELIPSTPLEIAENPDKFAKFDKSHLKKILMGVRPTSISCERGFSLCGRICIPIRGKMEEKSLNMIIFLNENCLK